MIEGVSEKDLGVWVSAESRSLTEQNLDIIKLAIVAGWRQYSVEAYKEMRDLYLNGEPDMTAHEELSWVLDEAVMYLDSQVPDGYYFTFSEGDFILTHEDLPEEN